MNEKVLTIEKLVSGGDGLARPADEAIVFVPGVAAGDRVRVELAPLKRGFRRGRLLEVLEAGPDRREAPCSLASSCGGCQWLHVSEEAQLRTAQDLLVDALTRVGRLDLKTIEVLPTKGLKDGLGYRQRVRLQLRIRGGPRLGFHRARSHEVLEVETCAILQPELEALRLSVGGILSPLAELLQGASQASLLLDLPTDGVATAELKVKGAAGEALGKAAELLLNAHPSLAAVLVVDAKNDTRAQAGESSVPYRHGTRETADRWPARHSPGGFLQASREGNALLIERLLASELVTDGGGRLLELHSGNGNFSLPLAEAGLDVTAVEREGQAHDNAQQAATEASLAIAHVAADAATWLRATTDAGGRFDQVLLDPPRTGAADVMPLLPMTGAKRIVYVSCDAVTLARDAATLSELGYRLSRAEPLLLFPQTSHFETLAVFERDAS